MIIKDDAGGMEEASEAFYLAFATDVRQFLGPILDQESTPQLNGKK
jgi:hypothetical protein